MATKASDRPPHAIAGVDTRPLRQQIADALQRAILDGEIEPGAPLVEMDIAHRLGVSRAPVREAIQLLAHADLVEVAPYRGTTVRRLTPVDVEEVYSLRAALETFALRRAMQRRRADLVDVLRSSCTVMQDLAGRRAWPELVAEDARFHEAIVDHAEHRVLMQAWRDRFMRVRQIMALRNKQNEDSMVVFIRHLPLLEAIERDDADAAVRALEEHIASAADLVLEGGMLED